ncbi:MAG: F0F1 ATP synthase subunit alpha, partial [Candidatus Pacebacteria bacterium]|nr:F0F1 ATP synthase subunit alpha [Candidatus Paceibacterota bacterium]
MKKNTQKEFSTSISKIISNLDVVTEAEAVGTVLSFGDGVVTVTGLDDVQSGELIDLGSGEFGLTLNLEKEKTGIVVLGDASHLSAGQTVKRTGRILSIGASDAILGRVVDALGQPVDGKGDFPVQKYMLLEQKAPGIMPRQSVSIPLQTGIKAIDAMIPVGRGQRELIIGDRSTGKTAVALGTIL